MNAIQEMASLHGLLKQQLTQDPVFRLMAQHTWAYLPDIGDFEGHPWRTLSAAKECFPSAWEEALALLEKGDLLGACAVVGNYAEGLGFDLTFFEEDPLGDSIPLPAEGYDQYDNDRHQEWAGILFGIYCEEKWRYESMIEQEWDEMKNRFWSIIQRYMPQSIYSHIDEEWVHVAWAIKWLNNSTGNSICDWTDDDMCSYQPPDWTADEAAASIYMLDEYHEILTKVGAGLNLMMEHPVVIKVLRLKLEAIQRPRIPPKYQGPLLDDMENPWVINDEEVVNASNARLVWPGVKSQLPGSVPDTESV